VTDLLQDLQQRGVSVRIDGQQLIVTPKALLTGELRLALLAEKAELLRLPFGLMAAIDRYCVARRDSNARRATLILECTVLPAWEQRELTVYFTEVAAGLETTGGVADLDSPRGK